MTEKGRGQIVTLTREIKMLTAAESQIHTQPCVYSSVSTLEAYGQFLCVSAFTPKSECVDLSVYTV